MEREKNGMATAGFVVSMVSLPLLVLALLCLAGVFLKPFLAVIFGEAAGFTALFGIALSGVGSHRSYQENTAGAGFSLAGLLTGTVVLTLVLAVTVLWIVAGERGSALLPVVFMA